MSMRKTIMVMFASYWSPRPSVVGWATFWSLLCTSSRSRASCCPLPGASRRRGAYPLPPRPSDGDVDDALSLSLPPLSSLLSDVALPSLPPPPLSPLLFTHTQSSRRRPDVYALLSFFSPSSPPPPRGSGSSRSWQSSGSVRRSSPGRGARGLRAASSSSSQQHRGTFLSYTRAAAPRAYYTCPTCSALTCVSVSPVSLSLSRSPERTRLHAAYYTSLRLARVRGVGDSLPLAS